jgi:hypothetical protein
MNPLNKKEEDYENDTIEKPSYSYWKRQTDKPFSNEFKPMKSDGSNLHNNTNVNSNQFGSAWNTAGTWEEKHLKKSQFEEFFNKSLESKDMSFKKIFKLDKISGYSGDVIIK